VRIFVRVLSLLGLGVHIFFITLLGAASGLSDSSSSASGGTVILLASPFVYFGYCLLSSFGHWRGVSLLVGGMIAHLCILPFLVRLVHDGVPLFGVPVVILSLCWAGMYLESLMSHDAEPHAANRR